MKRRTRFLLSVLSIFMIILFIGIIALIVFFHKFWYWIFVGLFCCSFIQIFISFYIFNSKRIYEVKLSWLLTMSVPLLGIFIFLMFGIIPFKLHSIKESKNEAIILKNKLPKNSVIDDRFSRLIYNVKGTTPFYKNTFDLVLQKDIFIKSIELIRSAKYEIHIQFYIITDCVWMRLLVNELIAKSKEGVKIQFMYDYAGSYHRFKNKMIKLLEKNNIEIAVFNPRGITKYISMINFRNHRKSIIIDNKYCLTGGSNIGDEYLNFRKKYDNWRDINYLISGEIANEINKQFIYDWYTSSSKRKSNLNTIINKKIHDLEPYSANNYLPIQMINSEPNNEYRFFKNLLCNLFFGAKKRILIISPYFAPGKELIDCLILVANLGINVEIALPHLPDNKTFILSLNRNTYNKFIENNIKIYEYNGFLHSKAILIDDDITILGTNNIDLRSFIINFETSQYIKSKEINSIIYDEFKNLKKFSIKVDDEFIEKNYSYFNKFQMYFLNIIYALL